MTRSVDMECELRTCLNFDFNLWRKLCLQEINVNFPFFVVCLCFALLAQPRPRTCHFPPKTEASTNQPVIYDTKCLSCGL